MPGSLRKTSPPLPGPRPAKSPPTSPAQSVAALLEKLVLPDDAVLAGARAETDARPIAYPMGSGQAEEIALARGLRPAIRQLLDAAEVDRARHRFERMGLTCELASVPLGKSREGLLALPSDAGGPRFPLFIGRDRGHLRAAIDAELALDDEGERALGRLLGYPRCCVEGWVSAARPRRTGGVLARALSRTRTAHDPWLNVLDFQVFHLVSWYPCSFDCQPTKHYAAVLADNLRTRFGAFFDAVAPALAAHRLVLTEDVQLSLEGELVGRSLRVDRVWPTVRDRHPRGHLPADEREAIARALVRVRGARTVEIAAGRWVLDGQEQPGPTEARLHPFGSRASSTPAGQG